MTMSQEEGTRFDAQRLQTAIGVRITYRRRKHDAVAVNLSPFGLCLRTDAPLEPDALVAVDLPDEANDAPKAKVKIKGHVAWVLDAAPLVMPNFAFVAGIRFDDPEDDYLGLVSFHRQEFNESRQSARVPHTIRVELDGAAGLISTFALNLGHRGLFVRYDRPVSPGDMMRAHVYLPAVSSPIKARCEVVHVLEMTRAREVGAPPGIGLQITSLSPEDAEAYRTYVDFLEDRLRL